MCKWNKKACNHSSVCDAPNCWSHPTSLRPHSITYFDIVWLWCSTKGLLICLYVSLSWPLHFAVLREGGGGSDGGLSTAKRAEVGCLGCVYTGMEWTAAEAVACSCRLNCSFICPLSIDLCQWPHLMASNSTYISTTVLIQSIFIFSMSANSSLIKASGNLTMSKTETEHLSAHWLVYWNAVSGAACREY